MYFSYIFLSVVSFVPQHVFNKPSSSLLLLLLLLLLLSSYYTGAHVERATDLQ